MYGTIPRLPERYALSTAYYRLLFSGQLGYELVNVEATYPELLGVGVIDETFERPGLPDPARQVRVSGAVSCGAEPGLRRRELLGL